MTAVLEIDRLSIDYATGGQTFRAVNEVSLAIAAGETLGIIGESGSGKSTLAFAVARCLSSNARITGGSIRMLGEDILNVDAARLQNIRRRQFGMVYQNAATALNPTLRIGQQVMETLTVVGTPRRSARSKALDLLAQVQLRDPATMMNRFPHQVSGGERQRVLVAMAIAGSPRLLNLDEPTTALDPETAQDILDLVGRLRNELGAAVLYISHDLETVARLTDRLVILKAGEIVEQGATAAVIGSPQHAYTKLLLASRPGHLGKDASIASARAARPTERNPNFLSARSLRVTYGRPGMLTKLGLGSGAPPPALDAVSLEIAAGRTVAVVGRSGSGKSTLGRALVGLVPFTGTITLAGKDYCRAGELDATYRRAVQIVFQNPDTSLNPRQRIGEILGRPLALLGGSGTRDEVSTLLEQVRLPPDFAKRFPHQLSGGQRQRISIARALAARPRLIICDEITSALDVSTQASIISLLVALQARHGTALLFISHDMALVRSFADSTIVVDRGAIVDQLEAGRR